MKNKKRNERRSPSRKTSPSGALGVATGSQFWVIDTDAPGVDDGSRTARGPFDSMAAAEAWMISDCRDTFAASDTRICDISTSGNWAKPMHIVEVRKTLLQVPTVNIGCALIPANTAGQPRRSEA